jgi:hypothetical protein
VSARREDNQGQGRHRDSRWRPKSRQGLPGKSLGRRNPSPFCIRRGKRSAGPSRRRAWVWPVAASRGQEWYLIDRRGSLAINTDYFRHVVVPPSGEWRWRGYPPESDVMNNIPTTSVTRHASKIATSSSQLPKSLQNMPLPQARKNPSGLGRAIINRRAKESKREYEQLLVSPKPRCKPEPNLSLSIAHDRASFGTVFCHPRVGTRRISQFGPARRHRVRSRSVVCLYTILAQRLMDIIRASKCHHPTRVDFS